MNIENKISLIITFGRSLLGEVTDTLRAAAVHVEGSIIYVFFFFNEEVTEEILDHYEYAFSEVYAPVPNEEFGSVVFKKIAFPEPLPDVGLYVFSRDTLFPKQIDSSELTNCPLNVQIRIALYQALLGRIPRSLRAVRFEINKDIVNITFSLESQVLGSELNLFKQAMQEFIMEFPQLTVKDDFEFGKLLPQISGYVFRRYKEPLYKS
jgi:hypothetical protein